MKVKICDKRFKIATGVPTDLSIVNVSIFILRRYNGFMYLKTQLGYAEIGH